jgi:hypothetical protein
MTGYNIRVEASTEDAERKLAQLDTVADKATQPRNIKVGLETLENAQAKFKTLSSNIARTKREVENVFKVARQVPPELFGDRGFVWAKRVGDIEKLTAAAGSLAETAPRAAAALRENAKAGNILANSFNIASDSALGLINTVAQAGIAVFGLKQAFGALNSVFGGAFSDTVGREIKFRETVLKSQTVLATTNRVFVNEKEITDPYQKIVSLTGEIEDRIASLRIKSLDIAGITSNEVVEVFGVVASQIGQINGSLKDAEDLSIKFAAALGIFGLPIYQARQEINSILQGTIDNNSFIARSLNITNEDIAKSKGQEGGVQKYLEEKLSAAVAGEKIAAEGFSGLTSNLRDLSQIVKQEFGKGLLDPILEGLSSVYFSLFNIREEIIKVAGAAGKGAGGLLRLGKGLIIGESKTGSAVGNNSKSQTADLEKELKSVFTSLKSGLESIVAPLRSIFDSFVKALSELGKGIANLAKGFVTVEFSKFQAVIEIFRNAADGAAVLATAFGNVLSVYGELLKLPLVNYLSQLQAQFSILSQVGLTTITKLAVSATFIVKRWSVVIAFINELKVKILTTVSTVLTTIGSAVVKVGALVTGLAGTITAGTDSALKKVKDAVTEIGQSMEKTGEEAKKAAGGIDIVGKAGDNAGKLLIGALVKFIKFNLILLAIQATVTIIVDLVGRAQQAQNKIASDKRAEEALLKLKTTYADIGDNASVSEKKMKAFNQSIVEARYDDAIQRLDELQKKVISLQNLNEDGGGIGKVLGRTLAALNPANASALFSPRKDGETWIDVRLKQLEESRKGIEAEREKWGIAIDGQQARDNLRTQAQNRIDLEKEIEALRKQQEDALFSRRQELAQKEVEIFQKAGELRIFQMEQANAKMIEGEEGASRVGLEALNTYISTRERGELEIESAKKTLAIEVINLEKQIADYRLENEKKIAEIRKKAGQWEQETAKYKRDLAVEAAQTAAGAGAPPLATGPGGFLVGSTGRSTGPHLDLRGDDREGVIREALAVIKEWQRQKVPYIELSNAKIDVTNMTDDRELTRALRAEQRAHDTTRRRRIGASQNAVDIAVPAGTRFPFPVTAPKWDPVGGWTSTSINTGNRALHGLPTSTATGSATTTTATAPTPLPLPPEAPDFSAEAGPAVAKYEEATRDFASALERLRSLQEAINEAQTAAAFENIVKAAFPKLDLEQFEYEIQEVELYIQALADTIAEEFNPDSLKIDVKAESDKLMMQKEALQILKGADKLREQGKMTIEKYNELEANLKTRLEDNNKDLETRKRLQKEILELTKQQATIERIRSQVEAIPFELGRAQVQAQARTAQAFVGDDPRKLRQIEAELRIAEERIQIEQDKTKTTEEINKAIQDFTVKTRAAADVLGELDITVQEFERTIELIKESARTITDGYKGFITDILSGSDLETASNRMLETVANKFSSMFLDVAFKPLEEALFKQFKELLNLQDPMEELTKENNDALTRLTEEVEKLKNAIKDENDKQASALSSEEEFSTTQSNDSSSIQDTITYSETGSQQYTRNTSLPVSQQVDIPVELALPQKPIAIKVIPVDESNAAPLNQSVNAPISNTLPASADELPDVQAESAVLAESMSNTSEDIREMGENAQQSQDSFKQFAEGTGKAFTALTGLALGISGIQQIGQGGTRNTLMGLAGIFGSIGSLLNPTTGITSLFKKSTGGSVSAKRPYLVGEEGPEIFFPQGDGQITSNAKTRELALSQGSIQNGNIDSILARNGEILARNQARADQQTLNQKSAKLEISYESQVINNVEYVTAADFQKGMTNAAERGRALSLKTLGNSIQIRRKLGLS